MIAPARPRQDLHRFHRGVLPASVRSPARCLAVSRAGVADRRARRGKGPMSATWRTTSSRAARSPRAGERCAGDYIATRFREIGLRPAGDAEGYFQAWMVRAGSALGEGNEFAVSGDSPAESARGGDTPAGFALGDDWMPYGFSASTRARAPMTPRSGAGWGTGRRRRTRRVDGQGPPDRGHGAPPPHRSARRAPGGIQRRGDGRCCPDRAPRPVGPAPLARRRTARRPRHSRDRRAGRRCRTVFARPPPPPSPPPSNRFGARPATWPPSSPAPVRLPAGRW